MSVKKKVAILYGGRSVEHAVSVNSAKNIFEYLDTTRFEAVPIGISTSGQWFLTQTVSKDIEQGKALGLMLDPKNPAVAGAEPAPSPPVGDSQLAREVKSPSRWTPPQALFDQLEGFSHHAAAGNWALKVRDDLETLGRAFEDDDLAEAEVVLTRLQMRLDDAAVIQADLADGAEAAAFSQVRYALIRRMNMWKLTAAMGGLDRPMAGLSEADWTRLAERSAAVDEYLRTPQAGPWKEFLRIAAIQEVVTKRSVLAEEKCRAIATAVLRDVTTRDLAPDQRRFLDQPALTAYLKELAFWRESAITAGDLLRTVERYEQSGSPADAEAVMARYYRLEPSTDEAAQAMARCLQVLYRNANVRVVVTADLLNRMMPARSPESRPVSDTILGRPVYGTSLADTTAYFRLLPDPDNSRTAGRVTSRSRKTPSPRCASTSFRRPERAP